MRTIVLGIMLAGIAGCGASGPGVKATSGAATVAATDQLDPWDAKNKGKRATVAGTVKLASYGMDALLGALEEKKDSKVKVVIVLACKGGMDAQCVFPETDKEPDWFFGVKKDNRMTIEGTCEGLAGNLLILSECRLVGESKR